MRGLKRYAWEDEDASLSWEEAESGMALWNAEADGTEVGDSSDEEPEPGEELLAYLLDEHNRGVMTAKQVCVISYLGGKAGITPLQPYGLPPETKGSGDLKSLGQDGLQDWAANAVPCAYSSLLKAAEEQDNVGHADSAAP